MSRNENKVASSFPSLNLMEISAMGQMQMEHLFGVQTEFLQRIQEASRVWSDRIQSEAKLASEFTEKVAKADSLPEAIKIYQDWNTRRLTIMAEDGRRLVEEAQQFIRTGSRLLSNGWSGNAGASS